MVRAVIANARPSHGSANGGSSVSGAGAAPNPCMPPMSAIESTVSCPPREWYRPGGGG